MAEVIKMRRMSDTMEEGVVVEWLVKVGDKVDIGDVLAEVETDKATMDFDAQSKGEILHIEAEEGSTVPIEGVMAVIGEKGEDFEDELKKARKEAESASSEKEEEEASKEEEEKEEPKAAQKEEKKGSAKQESNEKSQASIADSMTDSSSQSSDGRIKASPLAKKLAEEKGYSLSDISGSGTSGRIVKRDVESHTPSAGSPVTTMAAQSEGHHDESLSQMRKAIARRLSESKFTAPHFYLTREINMDRVVEARKSINDYLGSKVSFNDIIIKAAAAALRHNPKVNASWLGDKVRYYDHIHIGVAIAIDEGLIVPVIRHADGKTLSGISAEVKDLATKAKEKKLQPEEFSGNTFTISNLGMFGIDEFTAIVNPPDACILAVGGIKQKPIVKDGEIVPANMMTVTLSCDHRVVDGAIGAQFLKTFTQFLEEPLRILA